VGELPPHHQRLAGLDRQLQGQAMHGRPLQLQAQRSAVANGQFLLGFAFPQLPLVALHPHR